MSYSIILTIDVEDWFQVENFKQYIPFSSWSYRELRVEENTHRLLDLLDSQGSAVSSQQSTSTNSTHSTIKSNQSSKSCLRTSSPKATFFVLGWIAERLPHLVREIHARGHEVASHGYLHNLCNQQSHEELKKDLIDSKKLLEDIIGAPVFGYRAPSFAINNDILKIIEDCSYLYDSSYNSFAMNKRYGHIDISQNERKGIAIQISKTDHATSTKSTINNQQSTIVNRQSSIVNHQSSINNQQSSINNQQSSINNQQSSINNRQSTINNQQSSINNQQSTINNQQSTINNQQSTILHELPISNLKSGDHILPWGGGGYFRLIPFRLFKLGIQSILKKQNAYLFYMHPWELDPEQPRVKDAPAFFKFRHYINLSKTHSKILRLIRGFQHCHFVTCSQYLSTISYKPSSKP